MIHNKLLFIDIETTGLDVETHEIIEIGYIAVDEEDGVYVEKKEGAYKIKPEHIETADERSLRVNKYDPKKWGSAVSLLTALENLAPISKDRILVGHNVLFDRMFLESAYKKANMTIPFHYHSLDTISLSYGILKHNQDVQRLSLQYVADFFGITNENPHSALSDTVTTFEVF